MSLNLDEKRKSLSNFNSDVLDARVIANYGDAGLDENYHFDVLSRFLIVMIESSYRIPTLEKWQNMFAVVVRPKQLWIDLTEGKAASPNSQKRTDPLGNVTVGLAESPSTAGISQISPAYRMGELIKIKKLASPLKVGEDSLFVSQFTESDSDKMTYRDWHTEGSTLPYFVGHQDRIDSLKNKTIDPLFTANPNIWQPRLFKYQYEAFMLSLTSANSDLSNYISSIFQNTLPNSSPEYSAQGGYIFKENSYVDFKAAEYEDVNLNNKQRLSVSDCLPLVIAAPGSWPTPRARTLSLINYNPTYATIVREN